ncbi:hypothetical protein BC490_21435 [Vibrio parahaemolyticus]|nr:hypothetical protein [Vibrio parahaemolyticus]KIT51685.1 hypothetical protein H337_22050 [Vibrio parahaemolyticus EN9701121]RFD41710.1 hypothetical protein H328_006990 [Vibrio parahaemolyticus 3355]EGR1373490.1 hypothetical protein [Vibrio parahaemolyticus]EGR2350799.1 hypothetical protein [Vibrio parahaemolyticus]
MRQAIFYHGWRKILFLFLSIFIRSLRFLIGSEVATLKSPIFVRKSNLKKREGDFSRLFFLYWQECKPNICGKNGE